MRKSKKVSDKDKRSGQMRDKGDGTYWAVSLCLTNWQHYEVKSSANRRDNKAEGGPKTDDM